MQKVFNVKIEPYCNVTMHVHCLITRVALLHHGLHHLAFPHPCLYAGDFNCHHVDWGYDNSNPDGECLAGWASANNFTLLYSPKEAASFHSGRWKTDTNPDLAFASVDLDSRLPDRRILGKFPRSQHRPSLISPPKLAHPKPSKPVKRWNFRKANWDHYSNLTNKLAKSIPPPESQNIDQVYQCFCKVISTAAKKCRQFG